MKTWNIKIIFILIILSIGCKTSSKINTSNIVSENNQDIFILSTLIRNYLLDSRNTGINHEKNLDINELIQYDSLGRVSNHFDFIELKYQKGYVAVYFDFSEMRDSKKIELTDKEKVEIQYVRWKVNDSIEEYDGEIQFNFGERFYRTRKIIIKG